MREVFLHADGGGVLIPGRLACVPRAKPSLRMTMAEATCPSNAETHEGKVNSLSDRFNPTAVLQIGHMPVVLTNHRTSNRGCWPFSSRRLYVKTEHIKKISVPSLICRPKIHPRRSRAGNAFGEDGFPSKRPKMANHPRRDEVRLAGYKLVSGFPAELQGEEGGCGGQDPGLRVYPEGFRGGQIGDVRRVGPDILNHVEDQGLGVIGDVLEEVRGISAKMLEEVRG